MKTYTIRLDDSKLGLTLQWCGVSQEDLDWIKSRSPAEVARRLSGKYVGIVAPLDSLDEMVVIRNPHGA